MDRVRIGFIGVGNMGQNAHLRNYATLPDCKIAAIAELRSDPRGIMFSVADLRGKESYT
jgi:predicted dehydrogenase